MVPAGQFIGKGLENRMEFFLGQVETERCGHLSLSLCLGPGVGHGQTYGNTVGRVKYIPFLFLNQFMIKIHGKGRVSEDLGLNLFCCGGIGIRLYITGHLLLDHVPAIIEHCFRHFEIRYSDA